jgi:hypothetical protein
MTAISLTLESALAAYGIATISTPNCSGCWRQLGSSPSSSATSPTGRLSR